jgi:hypothetical protein
MALANDATSGTEPMFVLIIQLSLVVSLHLYLLLICSTGLLLITAPMLSHTQ